MIGYAPRHSPAVDQAEKKPDNLRFATTIIMPSNRVIVSKSIAL